MLAELARHQELAGQPEAARDSSLRAARWAVKRGAYEDAERLYRMHLRLLDGISEHAVEVRNEMGLRLFHLQGRMDRGRAEHRQALAEARQLGARRAEGHSLRLLALIEYHTGDLDEAEALGAEALSVAHETEEAWLEAATSNNLANLLNLRGRYDETAHHAEAALAIERRHGFEDLEATTLASLGMVRSNQGHLEQAETLYGEAIALLRRRGDRDEEGVLLSNLGNLARMRGQLDRARALHEEALQNQRQRGNLREEARVLGNLAHVELEAGRLEEAESLGRRALALNRQIGNRRSETFVLDALAVVEILQGKVEAARQTLLQNLEARRSMNSGLREVSILLDLAKLARHTEAGPGAGLERLEEVRALLDGAGDRWMMRAHWMCMMAHQELAEGRSAEGWLEQLRDLEASSGFKPTIQLQKGTEALLQAQAAFEAGETERLYRGELLQDVPEGLRRWLVRNGRLSEEQAGLPLQAPAPVGRVELQLDWD